MKILALDTATEACSVALKINNSVKEIFEVVPRQHTERILPMVDTLLAEADLSLKDLDTIAFDSGPGSFTGVRVGTSVAQGLAYSSELPVIPVSSLATLAQSVLNEKEEENVVSMIDARMKEVYWACYHRQGDIMSLVGQEQVSAINDIELNGSQWHSCGSGWDNYRDELAQEKVVLIKDFTVNCLPHAREVAELAAYYFEQGFHVSAEKALPTYVRDEVTWKKISEQ